MISILKFALFIVLFGGQLISPKLQAYSDTKSYTKSVYWGDTHVHSSWSSDADFWGGNISLTPEKAYLFAQGEEVISSTGIVARLERPLDFIAIADHAEGLGLMPMLRQKKTEFLSTDLGGELNRRLELALNGVDNKKVTEEKMSDLGMMLWEYNQKSDSAIDSLYQKIWHRVTNTSDQFNSPGLFTAFTAFEWTSPGSIAASNLHRVVIFADGADKTRQVLPFSANDSKDPEDLWLYMNGYESLTGGGVLAIPHNGNLSRGQMFSALKFDGSSIDESYSRLRMRWEPIYEVTQMKGTSEVSPVLSFTDEFSVFEQWDGWGESYVKKDIAASERHQYEYARPALQRGLNYKKKFGVNPFKFGLIGSTDSHTSLATASDSNFFGKAAMHEPSAKRIFSSMSYTWSRETWRLSASGYKAIWAEENTRESLFAAMKRKEVYASTGPRITVRFFGGWDYQQNDAYRPDLARIGYEKGVPMGGDLTAAPETKAPRFLIRAVKDPDGANLDRVQVIKGWHDAKGDLHEKIYNVALSDGRKENWRGKVKPVGNTVDVPDASYTNTIGDPELAVVWTDPDFNKDELAFYYLRVLEIPTPRWTAYDAKYFKLKDIPEEVPMITQERAYTSPIWYTPATE